MADPNGRTSDQVVKYERVHEYCMKCMQVRNKCYIRDEIKDKGGPRMVQKWQGKKVVEAGTSESNNDQMNKQAQGE